MINLAFSDFMFWERRILFMDLSKRAEWCHHLSYSGDVMSEPSMGESQKMFALHINADIPRFASQ